MELITRTDTRLTFVPTARAMQSTELRCAEPITTAAPNAAIKSNTKTHCTFQEYLFIAAPKTLELWLT